MLTWTNIPTTVSKWGFAVKLSLCLHAQAALDGEIYIYIYYFIFYIYAYT